MLSICLNMLKFEPEYAHKYYAYKKAHTLSFTFFLLSMKNA